MLNRSPSRPVLFVAIFFAANVGIASVHAADVRPEPEEIKSAISRALPWLAKGAAGSSAKRECFTCHNQALPVLAMVEARKRGFSIDETVLAGQLDHTAAHLKRGQKNYLEGRGQGGKAIAAGYALWALEVGGRAPDDTTAAVAGFLLEYQKQANHWSHPGRRPPSSGSDFTTTYVALRGLTAFGTDDQQESIDARKTKVRQWLLDQAPKNTEDRVFRLRALIYVDADEQTLKQAAAELIDNQRDDGGWAQTDDMDSDAYATATVVVGLIRAAQIAPQHDAVSRGIRYLIDAQFEDGTWHVVSRAIPFQSHFESGFPHGKDQFISIAASSWATLALVLSLPESRE